jgi:hypothetical protein
LLRMECALAALFGGPVSKPGHINMIIHLNTEIMNLFFKRGSQSVYTVTPVLYPIPTVLYTYRHATASRAS